jgi:NAD(P)-dependent dehydrogenase (short-subunit alcohol dehydrogenase family)
MMLTNASRLCVWSKFEDLVPAAGVIAVMTSELGSIAGNSGFWELYSSSKTALNMLMKCFASRHPDDARAMLLVAPGWVRTDMGGAGATLSIEESIPLVVDTVDRQRGQAGLATSTVTARRSLVSAQAKEMNMFISWELPAQWRRRRAHARRRAGCPRNRARAWRRARLGPPKAATPPLPIRSCGTARHGVRRHGGRS